MKKFLFIGIDFSKSKFDVSVLENIEQKSFAQETFDNSETGYKSFLKWLSKQSKIKRDAWLFCGEHTGIYSRNLSNFLAKQDLFIWLENPLEIKRRSGIKRTKTDRYDSLVIAQYACRHVDKAKAYKPSVKEIESLLTSSLIFLLFVSIYHAVIYKFCATDLGGASKKCVILLYVYTQETQSFRQYQYCSSR
jgi:transposase